MTPHSAADGRHVARHGSIFLQVNGSKNSDRISLDIASNRRAAADDHQVAARAFHMDGTADADNVTDFFVLRHGNAFATRTHLHDRRGDPGRLTGIKVSARAGTILGSFEIAVFVALAIWLVVKAGGNNTGNVFTLHFATIKGYKGFGGIAAGSIYTILAFIGFEALAPLAEEARNPRLGRRQDRESGLEQS